MMAEVAYIFQQIIKDVDNEAVWNYLNGWFFSKNTLYL